MGDEEARTLVARLWRVWQEREADGAVEYELRPSHLYFTCRLDASTRLYAYVPWTEAEVLPPNITLEEDDEELGCYMECYSTKGKTLERVPEPSPVDVGYSLIDMPHTDEDMHQFVARWMECFRRGCWLSGCPIEASMHEKMEWMQGFTREELGSWELKF
jgi:hypothetical protein